MGRLGSVYLGYRSIPRKYIAPLELKEVIEEIAHDLYEACKIIVPVPMGRSQNNDKRRITMKKSEPIYIRINELEFDKWDKKMWTKTFYFCTIIYHPDRKYIEDITIYGAKFNVNKSKRKWTDLFEQYAQTYDIPSLEALAEIADCIKDKEWEYEVKNLYAPKNPVTDEALKKEILDIMYNARKLFAKFIIGRLLDGDYRDISEENKNKYINLYKFRKRLFEELGIEIPLVYFCELPTYDERIAVAGESHVKRVIYLLSEYKTVNFRIDTVFDNARCAVDISYQPERKYISYVGAISNLSYTKNSKYEWMDLVSYGACELQISGIKILTEIVDNIRDKEWKKANGKPVEDSMKQEILEILDNAPKFFADYIYEKLKGKEGWINLWKFQRELEDVYKLGRSVFRYLKELPEYDNRFEIRGLEKKDLDSIEIRRRMTRQKAQRLHGRS